MCVGFKVHRSFVLICPCQRDIGGVQSVGKFNRHETFAGIADPDEVCEIVILINRQPHLDLDVVRRIVIDVGVADHGFNVFRGHFNQRGADERITAVNDGTAHKPRPCAVHFHLPGFTSDGESAAATGCAQKRRTVSDDFRKSRFQRFGIGIGTDVGVHDHNPGV